MDIYSNTLESLFTPEQLAEYNVTMYPFTLDLIDKVLKEKLAEDPDYEVFVPVIYYKYAKGSKPSTKLVIEPPGVFVSNKGNVYRNLNGEVKEFQKFQGDDDGYWLISFASNLSVGLHRLIGCCFVPTDGVHPKDVQIRHKDGDKLNYELDNLEWIHPQEETEANT